MSNRNEYIDQWTRENMQRITIKIRKDDPILKDMQDALSAGLAENQTALIKEALREWVDRHLNH